MYYSINTLDQLKSVLKGYRKSEGLTQKDMAARLDISQQTYQVLETNPQKITVERLHKVLNILGVKMYLSNEPLQSSLVQVVVPHQRNTSRSVRERKIAASAPGRRGFSLAQHIQPMKVQVEGDNKKRIPPNKNIKVISSDKDEW